MLTTFINMQVIVLVMLKPNYVVPFLTNHVGVRETVCASQIFITVTNKYKETT